MFSPLFLSWRVLVSYLSYYLFQENVFMHLTNYAINKNSEDFVRDDEAGSKR